MKRTELKRAGWPRNERGAVRSAGLARSGRIRPVSDKRQRENRQRRAMVDQLWPERPICAVYALFQIAPDSVPADVIGRCGRWADDVHEPLGRGRGGSITDPGNATAPCRPCHDHVTFTPESKLGWAYDAGLLRHSWPVPGGAS
ncbi:MAG TPA: hypothetical protein VGG54_23090 [Trebonia sp.]